MVRKNQKLGGDEVPSRFGKMKNADYVFEVSYEVCNKVGGIYAVLRSKTPRMVEHYGSNYHLIGFYDPVKARVEFDEQENFKNHRDITNIMHELEEEGIKVHYGKWLIPGHPKTFLIDSSGLMNKKNEIKTKLWDDFKIDSLHADNTFNEPVVWATAVGMLLERLIDVKPFKNSKCVSQFHEWLSGAGLLYIMKSNLEIGTVFTTHATMLGRSMAGFGVDLYKIVGDGLKNNEVASVDLARRYNVPDKHTIEVASAQNSDVFTTVSEITAKEAHYLLGRKPDMILPNGLDIEKFPEIEELSVLRRQYRNRMRNFLVAYFSRYYYVDFYNIRSVFISGRYEFHNKGIDLFIEALSRLNEKMKSENVTKNVIAFIWIPSATRGENIEVLKNISLYDEMEHQVESAMPEIKERILRALTSGRIPKNIQELLSEDFLAASREMMAHFTEKKSQLPPLCSFELSYPEYDDAIMRALRNNGLLNREEDKVKVIYYPAYLSSADRLIGLEYNQAALTCDLGVFPSYYEPWGYTPLETAAHGSLSITTDLSGFGKFIEGKGDGICVLKRENRKWEDIVSDLASKMYEIVMLQRKELVQRRINAKELSRLADWKNLVENYIRAHDLALENMKSR